MWPPAIQGRVPQGVAMDDRTIAPEGAGCLTQAAGKAEDRIRRQLQVNVAYYARRLDLIEERLRDLEREWDVERVVAVGAGVATLAGLVLGIFKKKWALLPVGAAALLIAHSADGCCDRLPVLRCLGPGLPRDSTPWKGWASRVARAAHAAPLLSKV